MLAAVLAASIARPPLTQHSMVTEATHSLLCVSTAADLKTAACNRDCNDGKQHCPEACFCLAAPGSAEDDLSLTMSADGLDRISSTLNTGRAVTAHLTSLNREATPGSLLKACSSLSDTVDHSWCDKNCNAEPSNCPETMCKCDGTRPACTEKGQNASSFGVVAVPCCAGMQVVNQMCTRDFAEASKAQVPTNKVVGAKEPSAPAAAWRSKLSAANPAKLPAEDVVGFYMKTWACKNLDSGPCVGLPKKNLNVAFSGEGTIETALARSVKRGGDCEHTDKKFCEDQIKYMRCGKTGSQCKDRAEAIEKITAPGQWTEEQCTGCFAGELPKALTPSQVEAQHPFSREAGLHAGVQMLDIGGASERGVLTVEKLQSFFTGGLDKVKDAGFDGICFDIEMTKGEAPLVKEFERAFAACKQAGLLVMITTSHSAPYASSGSSKELFVDSWAKSENIDIFSPQLYTSGMEGKPEYMLTPCRSGGSTEGSRCTWERLKPMKAKWVLSLANADHYAGAKEYFYNLGIETRGFIQWQDGPKDMPGGGKEPAKPVRHA
jgi:hypothetical protein